MGSYSTGEAFHRETHASLARIEALLERVAAALETPPVEVTGGEVGQGAAAIEGLGPPANQVGPARWREGDKLHEPTCELSRHAGIGVCSCWRAEARDVDPVSWTEQQDPANWTPSGGIDADDAAALRRMATGKPFQHVITRAIAADPTSNPPPTDYWSRPVDTPRESKRHARRWWLLWIA